MCLVCGVTESRAAAFLDSTGWDLSSAIELGLAFAASAPVPRPVLVTVGCRGSGTFAGAHVRTRGHFKKLCPVLASVNQQAHAGSHRRPAATAATAAATKVLAEAAAAPWSERWLCCSRRSCCR